MTDERDDLDRLIDEMSEDPELRASYERANRYFELEDKSRTKPPLTDAEWKELFTLREEFCALSRPRTARSTRWRRFRFRCLKKR